MDACVGGSEAEGYRVRRMEHLARWACSVVLKLVSLPRPLPAFWNPTLRADVGDASPHSPVGTFVAPPSLPLIHHRHPSKFKYEV